MAPAQNLDGHEGCIEAAELNLRNNQFVAFWAGK